MSRDLLSLNRLKTQEFLERLSKVVVPQYSGADRGLVIQQVGDGYVSINGVIFPVADGAAGEMLSTDGAGNLVFDRAPVPVYTDTISDEATTSIISQFEAGFDYRIVVSNFRPATNGAHFRMQLRNASGAVTGSSYVSYAEQIDNTTSTKNSVDLNLSVFTYAELANSLRGNSSDTAATHQMILRLSNPAVALKTVYCWEMFGIFSNGASYTTYGSGYESTAQAITGVNFFCSTGNNFAGNVRVYKEAVV